MMTMTVSSPDLFARSGATFSECGLYRYDLWRQWDDVRPRLTFIMLNPSTADAEQDDPTIRRCMSFASREKFGSVRILNVFALRSTNPKGLLTVVDPCGPRNAEFIASAVHAAKVVVAWGNLFVGGKKLRHGYQSVLEALADKELFCLGRTRGGHPRHPLYVSGSEPLILWPKQEY